MKWVLTVGMFGARYWSKPGTPGMIVSSWPGYAAAARGGRRGWFFFRRSAERWIEGIELAHAQEKTP